MSFNEIFSVDELSKKKKLCKLSFNVQVEENICKIRLFIVILYVPAFSLILEPGDMEYVGINSKLLLIVVALHFKFFLSEIKNPFIIRDNCRLHHDVDLL